MGQYFKLVNESKKEQVISWHIGGVAKFFEWLYNPQARVLVWLLRKSDGDGGGDIHERHYQTLGRWAGDKITLVGDYDSSGLYEQSDRWTDISVELKREFNKAIKNDGCKDKFGL